MTTPKVSTPPEDQPFLDKAKIIDTYCELAEQLAEAYRARRSLEWRMHVALWTLLGVIIYLCIEKDQHLEATAAVVFFAVPIHLVWIVKIARGQIREQELSKYYRSCAVNLLQGAKLADLPPPPKEEGSTMPPWLDKSVTSYLWWVFVLIGTTLILCTIAWALLRKLPN